LLGGGGGVGGAWWRGDVGCAAMVGRPATASRRASLHGHVGYSFLYNIKDIMSYRTWSQMARLWPTRAETLDA